MRSRSGAPWILRWHVCAQAQCQRVSRFVRHRAGNLLVGFLLGSRTRRGEVPIQSLPAFLACGITVPAHQARFGRGLPPPFLRSEMVAHDHVVAARLLQGRAPAVSRARRRLSALSCRLFCFRGRALCLVRQCAPPKGQHHFASTRGVGTWRICRACDHPSHCDVLCRKLFHSLPLEANSRPPVGSLLRAVSSTAVPANGALSSNCTAHQGAASSKRREKENDSCYLLFM